MNIDFDVLKGQTLTEVNVENERITFKTAAGDVYVMNHSQDCCEHVYVEDVVGDVSDLIGSPILLAEEISSEGEPALCEGEESYTWTFYKLRTDAGDVTIRWYGSSNGYYSESVYFWKS
jgi:hypothetical protein